MVRKTAVFLTIATIKRSTQEERVSKVVSVERHGGGALAPQPYDYIYPQSIKQ